MQHAAGPQGNAPLTKKGDPGASTGLVFANAEENRPADVEALSRDLHVDMSHPTDAARLTRRHGERSISGFTRTAVDGDRPEGETALRCYRCASHHGYERPTMEKVELERWDEKNPRTRDRARP